jgi:hypothetical protein
MVMALAAQLHKYFGIPGEPKSLIISIEFDGAAVNAKMVTSEL